MKFICVGFDVRQYPCNGLFSADSAEWERDEYWHSKLVANWNAVENEYGLLSIDDKDTLRDVSKHLNDVSAPCDLIAVELPYEVVRFVDSSWGYRTSSNQIDLSIFVCLGLDVCEIDGLITLLNNPLVETFREPTGLISETRIVDALEAVQLANVVEPSHRPCVVAKVYSSRKIISCGK